VGRLGLMTAYPQEYVRMMSVTEENEFDVQQVEMDLFDIDHCMAGAWLAGEWALSTDIAVVAQTHHHEPTAGDTDVGNLLRITNRMTNVLGFTAVQEKQKWEYGHLRELLPAPARNAIPEDPDALQETVRERLTMLQMSYA
jgi:HD-like signal output (HDOD) protein